MEVHTQFQTMFHHFSHLHYVGGGLEHGFYCPFHIWYVILPIDELHHFSRWLLHHQPEYHRISIRTMEIHHKSPIFIGKPSISMVFHGFPPVLSDDTVASEIRWGGILTQGFFTSFVVDPVHPQIDVDLFLFLRWWSKLPSITIHYRFWQFLMSWENVFQRCWNHEAGFGMEMRYPMVRSDPPSGSADCNFTSRWGVVRDREALLIVDIPYSLENHLWRIEYDHIEILN